MPVALNPTVTRLGTTVPAAKFRLETVGLVVPSGKTVRYPAAVGSTAVTLSTAATAPAGTPDAAPVTWTLRVAPPARGELVRVSATLAGVTDTYELFAVKAVLLVATWALTGPMEATASASRPAVATRPIPSRGNRMDPRDPAHDPSGLVKILTTLVPPVTGDFVSLGVRKFRLDRPAGPSRSAETIPQPSG